LIGDENHRITKIKRESQIAEVGVIFLPHYGNRSDADQICQRF
jgi:hypothetical protein